MQFSSLSPRSERTLIYIAQFIKQNGFPPSYREIQKNLSIASTSSVQTIINELIEKGLLKKTQNSYRSLQFTNPELMEELTQDISIKNKNDLEENINFQNFVNVPELGDVAAGRPLFAQESIETYIPIPETMLGRGNEYFILRIRGESMINAGIFDGDKVIIKKQNTARMGQHIVALIEDSATVKTYMPKLHHVELLPENDYMKPIIVKYEDLKILGIVVGLLRTYKNI